MENQIYDQISSRTGGDIYIGVVGPVRTGKSTFIKRFMETMVLPDMENPYKRERARDELPQSGTGTEDTKGDPLRKEAYALLKKAGDEGRLNFVGNVEGSMVPLGACDVAVCDGFTGNVQLKTIEGVAKFMSKEIKGVFMASVGTKLGYLLCKKGMDDFREVFNQDKIGGAPFLGIAKPVIKAHGSSNEIAVMNAVRQAIAYTKSGMIDAVKENIQYMTVSE